MTHQRTYLCIDLKSFYASVECIERDLDPLNINLVVADASPTEKTICLAVSPSLFVTASDKTKTKSSLRTLTLVPAVEKLLLAEKEKQEMY